MLSALRILALLTVVSPETTVRGVVRDTTGLPLPHVTVYIKGTQLLSVTDDDGRFELTIHDPGPITVVAFLSGFKPREIHWNLSAMAEQQPLDIVLELAAVTESVTVRPVSSSVVPVSSQPLRPLDIVRMAGSQADTFRALQSLSGVVKIDEGAGLFVRGGDTEEVLVTLDGVTLAHPYRYETPTGGLFGTFEPFLLEGLSFTTGGFSARYGNSLSAVLELHGLGRPQSNQLSMTAGLAAASGRASLPIGKHAGIRLSGTYSFTRLLFAVNGRSEEFDRFPEGWDVNASAHYQSPAAGSLKLFAGSQRNQVGVEIESEAFRGFLHSTASNRLLSARWEKLLGPWRSVAAIGEGRYARITDAGVLDIDIADGYRSWRLDLERAVGRANVRVGTDGGHTDTDVAGRVPARGGDLGGAAGTELFSVVHSDWRAGGYAEVERTVGAITPVVGARIDRFDHARAVTADPRAALVINLSGRQRVRLAWGIYHQAPSAEYHDRIRGGTRLEPMEAKHWIAGYEFGAQDGPLFLRSEAYLKRYRQLPVDDPSVGFNSSGFGSARGVDLFARVRRRRSELQANYSWLYARRRWTSIEQHERFDVPEDVWTPDFAIPHSFHLLTRHEITPSLAIGVGWRVASGRPTTPVVSATKAERGYSPVYGPINSERLPRYERWDLAVSYVTSLWPRSFAVLFMGVTNLFDRHNFFAYAYSPDFSVRRPTRSAAPRSIYFGLSFSK